MNVQWTTIRTLIRCAHATRSYHITKKDQHGREKRMNRITLVGTVIGLSLFAGACTNMEDMPGPDRPKICTKEYMPVCAAKKLRRQTFGNACEAQAAGYLVIREGKCGS